MIRRRGRRSTGSVRRPAATGCHVTLIGVAPRPPLALNTTLVDSARFKAPGDGGLQLLGVGQYVRPPERRRSHVLLAERAGAQRLWLSAADACCPMPCVPSCYLLDDDSNQIESIAAGYGPGSSDYTEGCERRDRADRGRRRPRSRPPRSPARDGRLRRALRRGRPRLRRDAAASTYHNYWAFHTGVKASARDLPHRRRIRRRQRQLALRSGRGSRRCARCRPGLLLRDHRRERRLLDLDPERHRTRSPVAAVASAARLRASVGVIGFNREVDCISGEASAFVDFVAGSRALPRSGSPPPLRWLRRGAMRRRSA